MITLMFSEAISVLQNYKSNPFVEITKNINTPAFISFSCQRNYKAFQARVPAKNTVLSIFLHRPCLFNEGAVFQLQRASAHKHKRPLLGCAGQLWALKCDRRTWTLAFWRFNMSKAGTFHENSFVRTVRLFCCDQQFCLWLSSHTNYEHCWLIFKDSFF